LAAPSVRTPWEAAQPGEKASHLEAPDPKIELPPNGGVGPGVLAGGSPIAAGQTDEVPAAERHSDHHDLGLEGDLFDPDTQEGEKAREFSGDTQWRPSFARLADQLRTYGPVRVTSRSGSAVTCGRLLAQPVLAPEAQPRTNDLEADLEPAAIPPSGSKMPAVAQGSCPRDRIQHPHSCLETQRFPDKIPKEPNIALLERAFDRKFRTET